MSEPLPLPCFEVPLPSRAVIKFHPIGARDLSQFGKSSVKAVDKIVQLLTSCSEPTVSPGPYKESIIGSATSRPTWSRVPLGDLTYALLSLYKGSLRRPLNGGDKVHEGFEDPSLCVGDVVSFDYNCNACHDLVGWEVLTDDLLRNVTPITDDLFEDFAQEGTSTLSLHGRTIKWRPNSYESDKPWIKLYESKGWESETEVELLAKYLTEVPGLELNRQTPMNIWLWCQSLSADDLDDLLIQLNQKNYGLDGFIQLRCPKCKTQQVQVLPFVQIFATRRSTITEMLSRRAAERA